MRKPNIILIMTDQQRIDTIGALGYPYMDTPNLDRFVNEGVYFANCYVTAPTCVPSRASLFNGHYPDTSGVYKNQDLWQETFVSLLSDEGYHCVNIGKMHTYPLDINAGFHERFVVENKDRFLEDRYYFDQWDLFLRAKGMHKQCREEYRKRSDYKNSLGAFFWEMPKETHSDCFVGDMASWWVENKHDLDEPFFMQLGFLGPHPPYDPLEEAAKPYLDRELPVAINSDEESQPIALKMINEHNTRVDHDSIYWKLLLDKDQVNKMRAHYYANVTMIDEKIGQLMDTLDKRGFLNNTIVIFTSDHGDCLGDHGHSQKWNMYDVTTKVPLVFWSKDKRFLQGKREMLIQHFDLGPTILDLAKTKIPKYYESRSLMQALITNDYKGRDYVISIQGTDGRLEEANLMQMTMIRDEKYKLVHYLKHDDGQLFDLENDPDEINNLWDDESYQEVKQAMLIKLLEDQMTRRIAIKDKEQHNR